MKVRQVREITFGVQGYSPFNFFTARDSGLFRFYEGWLGSLRRLGIRGFMYGCSKGSTRFLSREGGDCRGWFRGLGRGFRIRIFDLASRVLCHGRSTVWVRAQRAPYPLIKEYT